MNNDEFKLSSIYEHENPEKEIDEFEGKLKAAWKGIFEKAEEIIGADGGIWFMDKIGDFSEKIAEKYDDRESYAAWHVLGGSTMLGDDRKALKKKDFFGTLSVENFLIDLLKELEEIENSGEEHN